MKTIALECRNIYKSFGAKKVHQDINFELYTGEILGLLGGSGTGKSLILRSIIGLEKPDSGSIIFNTTDITKLSEKELIKIRTQIGYVFQNGALFDSLTIEENLAYPLKEHTQLTEQQVKESIEHMLVAVNMKGTNHLFPSELSGGMQKRAGLARAIILKPKIILFDEPTAGLDPSNTKKLILEIKELKKSGITGIFVTHDIPSCFELCDRIALLKDEKIYTTQTTEAIQKSYDPIVQSFISGNF